MKHLLLFTLLALSKTIVQAQTNTFPASGNAGIGTTSPGFHLDIRTSANYQGIQVQNSNGRWSRWYSSLENWSFNGITKANDAGIIFGGPAVDYGFVIAPHQGGTTGLRISADGKVGIASSNPTEQLDVNGNVHVPLGKAFGYAPSVDKFTYDNKEAGNYALGWSFDSWNPGAPTGYLTAYGGWKIFTAGQPRLSINGQGNVGIGTLNPDFRLTVKGKIKAEEIQVVIDVPADYVFSPEYKLMPLSEVSKYIKENNHLPNIPSAEELKEKGWQVGEMNNKLLEKVEELTLYLIEVKEENVQLRRELNELKAEIKSKKHN